MVDRLRTALLQALPLLNAGSIASIELNSSTGIAQIELTPSAALPASTLMSTINNATAFTSALASALGMSVSLETPASTAFVPFASPFSPPSQLSPMPLNPSPPRTPQQTWPPPPPPLPPIHSPSPPPPPRPPPFWLTPSPPPPPPELSTMQPIAEEPLGDMLSGGGEGGLFNGANPVLVAAIFTMIGVLTCCACAAWLMWRARPGAKTMKAGPRAVLSDELFPGLVKKLAPQPAAEEKDVPMNKADDKELARVLQQRLELAEELRAKEQWALDEALFEEESDVIRQLSLARASSPAPPRTNPADAAKRRRDKLPSGDPPDRAHPPAPEDADVFDFEVSMAEMDTINRLSIGRTNSIEAKRGAEGKRPVHRS